MRTIQTRLAHSEHQLTLDARRLTLGREIGSGNGATVYEGQLELGWNVVTPVAIKVFGPTASDDRDAVVSVLAKSASALSRCRHPNVVQVYEFGVTGTGRPFLVEERVEGCSLAQLVAHYDSFGQRVPLDLALFIGLEVADALAGALGEGDARLVHGDLSLREVLCSRHGLVKVSDFGFGAASRASSGLHSMSAITVRMTSLAPEVVDGREGDARSDVFSLGVLLWQMLVGPRFPTTTSDKDALVLARRGFVHSTIFDPNLPEPLRALLVRALDASPRRRFPDAAALAYDLRRIAFTLGIGDGRPFLKAAVAHALGTEAAPRAVPPAPPANDSWLPPSWGGAHDDAAADDGEAVLFVGEGASRPLES